MLIENEIKLDYKDVLFKPKRSTLHGINGFWLSNLDHYKNNNIGLTRKNKQKVAEQKETAEVLEFSQKKRT